MQPLSRVAIEINASENGTANSSWLPLGIGILLLSSMTFLEGLIYRCTGGGFLLP